MLPDHEKWISIPKEREIVDPVQLCNQHGMLQADSVGFSRKPLHTCNLSGSWPRKKMWNYWCVTTPDFLFSATISNLDYLGMVFCYFLDFQNNRFIEKTISRLFGSGCSMPQRVEGDVHYEDPHAKISFQTQEGSMRILTKIDEFGDVPLDADLIVSQPFDHETMNVVIPWNRRQFQYTSKQNCLPVSGTVLAGGKNYGTTPGASYACLDFGRGIWPYESFWNWASSSGVSEGHTVGLNLGGRWTDGTGFTENGIVVDSKLIKIGEDIIFQYDPKHFMKPWSIRTCQTQAVDLSFKPFFERVAKTNAFILRSEVHQMIGRFSGWVRGHNGEVIELKDQVGWAEEHRARW